MANKPRSINILPESWKYLKRKKKTKGIKSRGSRIRRKNVIEYSFDSKRKEQNMGKDGWPKYSSHPLKGYSENM